MHSSMASPRLPSLVTYAPLLLSLLFLSTSPNATLSCAADYISFNRSLSGNQTITSQGGKFVLGFFRPGNKSSLNYYVGIWYNKIPKLTPVWVANRENPISDPASSELKISHDGNLVLLNQFKTQVWSTNLTFITSNSTVAWIQDSGNLILRDGSDPSKVFWHSFDHPTDTWLPGAKLGLNKVTGETQRVIAWKSDDDPAPGIFSLEIDPNGSSQYFLVWNRTKQYWTSGEWNGEIFSQIPEMMSHYFYNFDYVSSATMNYFSYSPQDDTIISRLVVHPSGSTYQLTWLESSQQWMLFWSEPKKHCEVYAACGPFGSCNENSLPFCSCVKGFTEAFPTEWDLGDRSAGCVRSTALPCGANGSASGKKDKFYPMPSMRLPDGSHSLAVATTKDCESACLKDCSCAAYSYSNACSIWYGDLLNLQLLSDGYTGETLYLRLAASELPDPKSKKGVATKAAAGVGALAFLVVVLLLIVCSVQRRRTVRIKKMVDGNLVLFRYNDLRQLTKNFSEKLGGGGFGSVFKGMLPDSTPVAVKKLEGVLQGEKQFRAEVSTIGTVQHVNLVRLHGFCSEGAKRLLVYEYMPNGSLSSQLFHSRSMVLSWDTRYQIALGAARGLAYLHENCRDCIIHCDVKPENILLDASFVPKVADFGLAKLVGRDISRVLTTTRGTIGYLAPEWISGSPITPKADVYSYGMTLLEIVSGRRNMEKYSDDSEVGYFPTLAASKVVEGDARSLLDHRLGGEADMVELNRACKIACWCIQDNEACRPSMGQVVQLLEGVIEVNVPPIPRTLQIFEDNPPESIVFFSDSASTQRPLIGSTTSTCPLPKIRVPSICMFRWICISGTLIVRPCSAWLNLCTNCSFRACAKIYV